MSVSALARGMSAVVLSLLFACADHAAAVEPRSAAAGQVYYLYIDANEDQASGGHAAVRIDQDVFHFQFDSGLLALARDDWADFQLSYRGYQNRNIHQTHLDVSSSTATLLREAFVRRYLTQSAQIDRVTDARRDVQLVRELLGSAEEPLLFPGLGFFVPRSAVQSMHADAGGDSIAPGWSRLQQLIAGRYGADYLRRRQRELATALVSLEVHPVSVRPEDFQSGVLPIPQYAFNRRYSDLAAALRAIDVLRDDWVIDPARLELTEKGAEQLTLATGDREVLARMVEALEQRLLALLDSRRPDWGPAFLLALVRYEAMRLSLQRERFVFVDVLHRDAEAISVGAQMRSSLPGLQTDALQMWQLSRTRWLGSDGWDERRYAELETRAVNLLELERVAAGAEQWRIRDKHGIARGRGYLYYPPLPAEVEAHGGELERELALVHMAAQAHAEQQLGYQLLSRNCVSELFATVDQAMAGALREQGNEAGQHARDAEAVARLGGVIEPSPVPFYSSRQVRKYWRVQSHQELRSLRRIYSAEQYRENPSIAVWLRESNTLTSSVYRRSDDDSFFIFFTDGNAAARPVFGLVNLTSALGVAAIGVVQAPFDSGHRLSAGLRGALFSLPELGFQNIRKGTSTWLVPELREPPPPP